MGRRGLGLPKGGGRGRDWLVMVHCLIEFLKKNNKKNQEVIPRNFQNGLGEGCH